MKSTKLRIAASIVVLAQLLAAPAAVMADSIRPAAIARNTLHVAGMIGDSCPVLITSALKRVDGVHHVEASYATHSATVEYDPQRVSLDQIRGTIRRQAGIDTTLAE